MTAARCLATCRIVSASTPDISAARASRLSLGQRAGGACLYALAAEDAVALFEAAVEGGRHFRPEAAAGIVDGHDPRDLVAGPDAPAAENALVVVPADNGVVEIDRIGVPFPLQSRLRDPHLVSQGLKLAVSQFFAGHAVEGMVRQEKLHHEPAGFEHAVALRADLHPGRCLVGARRYQIPHPLHLDEAHPAGGSRNQIPGMTEGRYMHPGPLRRLQDGRALGNCNLAVVD